MRRGSVRCPLDHRLGERRFRAKSKRSVPLSCSASSRRDPSHPPKRPVSLPVPAPPPSVPPRGLSFCSALFPCLPFPCHFPSTRAEGSRSPRGPSFCLPPATQAAPQAATEVRPSVSPRPPDSPAQQRPVSLRSSPEACLFVHLHTPRRVPSVFPPTAPEVRPPIPSSYSHHPTTTQPPPNHRLTQHPQPQPLLSLPPPPKPASLQPYGHAAHGIARRPRPPLGRVGSLPR